ncbi:MAG: hypothetical protein UIC64_00065 [Agathobacter sp.]|nr:hypothetical protein [Agathobacter sp.]
MKNLSNSSNYQNAQVYSEQEKLPVGAYLLKIEDVKYEDNSSKGYNDNIIFRFDISEGEYAGFFRKNYSAQTGEDKKWKGTYRLRVPMDDGSEKDGWTQNRFKTVIAAFEESNDGYHWNWDEMSLKGKIIGAIFNEKEYDYNGRHGFFTNCYCFISKNAIATAKIPGPTLLKNGSSASVSSSDGFMQVADTNEEEIPFN